MSASNEAILAEHLLILGQACKTDTNTKLQTFNTEVVAVFGQINTVLTSLTNRIAALENFLKATGLKIDADGNIAQEIEEEES